MAYNFDELNKILDKASIVDVVGHYLPLTKKGNYYLAKCPFHNDTNPSMSVNPQLNIYKCFVCGAGGRPVSFVMRYTGMKWIDAVKEVASICSLTLPKEFLSSSNRLREHDEEYKALNELQKFYSYRLKLTAEGKEAYSYLKDKRKLSDQVIDKFLLGYAPLDQTKSITYLRNLKFDVSVLDKAGITSSNGKLEDRYSDRIMFPLTNARGEIIGFSGRVFRKDDERSKYSNSPETVLFHKSEVLYNLNNALPSLRKEKAVYVVEGFMDAIALYRSGILNAVALMGTALTKEHVDFFKKENVEVRLALDNDNAGQINMIRCLDVIKGSGLNVVCVKPYNGGKDADELLDNKGAEAVKSAFSTFVTPLSFLAEKGMANGSLLTYAQKQEFLEKYASYYYDIPIIGRNAVSEEVAAILKLRSDDVRSFFSSQREKGRNEERQASVPDYDAKLDYANLEISDYQKMEVANSLQNYVSEYSRKNSILISRSLLKSEVRIFVQMTSSEEAYRYFRDPKTRFYFRFPYFDSLCDLIHEQKNKDFTSGVEYKSEMNYEHLLNRINQAIIEQNGEEEGNVPLTPAQRAKIDDLTGFADKIITQLVYCRYPAMGKEISERDLRMLNLNHQKLLLRSESVKAIDSSYGDAFAKASGQLYKEKSLIEKEKDKK